MSKLSKKERRFRFKYNLGGSLIECNLPEEHFEKYLGRYIEPETNPLGFAKFLADKTHYHKVKYNGTDISKKQNTKTRVMHY